MARPAPFGTSVQARPSRVSRNALQASCPRTVAQAGRLGACRLGVGDVHAFDYFESDTSVDARNVAVEGHSSYGKVILIAYKPGWTIASSADPARAAPGARRERRTNRRIALDGRRLP